MIDWLKNLWKSEPVMVLSIVESAVALAASFGFSLTPEQIGSLLAFLSILLGLGARSQVFSPATVEELGLK